MIDEKIVLTNCFGSKYIFEIKNCDYIKSFYVEYDKKEFVIKADLKKNIENKDNTVKVTTGSDIVISEIENSLVGGRLMAINNNEIYIPNWVVVFRTNEIKSIEKMFLNKYSNCTQAVFVIIPKHKSKTWYGKTIFKELIVSVIENHLTVCIS